MTLYHCRPINPLTRLQNYIALFTVVVACLEGVGAEAVIEAALRRFTSDACVQSDGQAALVSMRRRVATRPADDLA